MIANNTLLTEYENNYRVSIPVKAKQEILTQLGDESIHLTDQDIHQQIRKILRDYNIKI